MQLAIEDSSLEQVVDLIMKKRGYVPENQIVGRTIGIDEFAKKYAKPHGPAWVKRNILYPFQFFFGMLIMAIMGMAGLVRKGMGVFRHTI